MPRHLGVDALGSKPLLRRVSNGTPDQILPWRCISTLPSTVGSSETAASKSSALTQTYGVIRSGVSTMTRSISMGAVR